MIPRNKGFTLIELLIVVAIIGILAAIAVPNFLNARLKANLGKAYADIKALGMANEMYALDWGGAYPTESEDHPYERSWGEAGVFWLTTPVSYIGSIPTDPFERADQRLQHATPLVYETGVATRNRKRIAYVIFSVGPDGSENGLSSANPFYGPQRGGQNNTYNRTNGLKSGGDLYLYGGDCSIAKSLVVDGIIYQGRCPPSFRN